MKYEHILFDWDGTIARTLDIWSDALRATLHTNGHAFKETDIGADYELFRAQFKHLGDHVVSDIINQALITSANNIPSVKIYEDIVETLHSLHKHGVKLGIVTTSPHSDIDPLLEKFEIKNLFDVVVCGDDVTKQKPDAEPILKALKLLDATPRTTLMVGDSDKDIAAANNAGIDSVLFYPPEHQKFHDLQSLKSLQPTYIINKHQDLIDIAITR